MIACQEPDCACRSTDPRDRRDRASVVIRYPDANAPEGHRVYLIDTSPDLRHQALRAGLTRIDGVFYTHAHADHMLGIDDLRRFNAVMKTPIDLYAEPRVIETLRRMFAYIFESHNNVNPSFVADLVPWPITPGESTAYHGTTWTPLRLMHGQLPIVGYRIEYKGHALAYCTDVSSIPPETYPLLQDLDLLVIDGLRYRHHPTHLTVDQAVEVIERVGPKRALLTHMSHEVIHAELEPQLPEHIGLAYDGLTITLGSAAGVRSGTSSDCP